MRNTAFEFGLRKLQTVRRAYLLSIPVDWIRNMNLSKGDVLNVEMLEDNSLRITPFK
jgi:hypothetical protein